MNIKEFMSLDRADKVVAIKRKLAPAFKKNTWGGYGKNSCILKPMLIKGKKSINIGDNVLIREGARIEAISNWNDEMLSPTIMIGSGTCIEERFHLVCANRVIIGNDCTISCDVMISDNEHKTEEIGKSVLEQALSVADIIIDDECFIGAGAKILAGTHIGRHSIIGANSVVKNDIPAYSIAVGIPAKVVKQYNFELQQWVRI